MEILRRQVLERVTEAEVESELFRTIAPTQIGTYRS